MTAGELDLPTTPEPASIGGRRSAIVSGLLLVLPLLLVVAVSFGVRGPDGGYVPAFTLDNYATVLNRTDPFVTSLQIAAAGTVLCLLVAFPLAYFIATRVTKRKGLLVVLLVIPFWTSFLI